MQYDAKDLDPNDIAIIGMALRVPGACNTSEFWENLRSGTESIRTLTRDELIEAGESPEVLQRRNYVARAAELPRMEMFDAEFFGFSPKEAAIMDPQHRQFLECSWEALEDSLRPPSKIDGPVGVFAGCGMGSYFYFNVCSHRNLREQVGMFLLRHTGNDKDFLATRASYLFDLHGPSVNVQTACSTSLVAVHYACQSLLNDECEMALAGGVTIELPHRHGYLCQDGEILSPDGHCRAFDHRAAGTVFGSGVGTVVLRRLSDAVADGDPIRAVIKATAINNDGASKAGYLAPSVSGQAEAIVEALGLAGAEADSIQYVECHGTGTYLGDPIEIAALTQAYRQTTDKKEYCRVGSVKSNIGHLDTAAGVVSLIKTTLALEHGEIPPTLGFEKPNPEIAFETSPFIVNDSLTPWPSVVGPRRAGVNSLGVGGTNAHVILEQAPMLRDGAARRDNPLHTDKGGPQLIALSAKSRPALDAVGSGLAVHLDEHSDLAIEDVAWSLIDGRQKLDHGRLATISDRDDAIKLLSDPKSSRWQTQSAVDVPDGAVFLFPGGGVQHPGMAEKFYASEAAFSTVIDEGLGYLPAEVSSEIRALWFGDTIDIQSAAERFLLPSLQLPAILILEVALARQWMSHGVQPSALIGHSMGENAAACIAGVITFERAVNLVHLRGMLFDEIKRGGMLSVALPSDDVRNRLPATLDLAAINAADLCVVSGPNDQLDAFAKTLARDDIDTTRVPIDIAAHSRMLDPILTRFEEFLRETTLLPPTIPIMSNVTGSWLTAEEATDPSYWVSHLRSTVQFADGMDKLSETSGRLYIETGPGRVLSSLAKAQGEIKPDQIISSLPHNEEATDDQLHFLTSLGRAWTAGLPVSAPHIPNGQGRTRVRLPLYPFQHQHYFLDAVASSSMGAENEHLLKISDIESWGWRPAWKPTYADTRVGSDHTPETFLVFMDDTGEGEALVQRLEAAGHTVRIVRLGDDFASAPDGHFTLCPEQGRAGYDELVRILMNDGGVPQKILHLWLLTSNESFRPGSSFFNRNQERGFYSLFYLAQALGNVELESELQITVLTNGMQRVGEETLPYPDKATVLGPVQVIPKELNGVSVRAIDLAMEHQEQRSEWFAQSIAGRLTRSLIQSSTQGQTDLLWDDLFSTNGNEIVSYRAGRRLLRTSEQVALTTPEPATGDQHCKFRESGVYMLTGGLGDLALACAEQLASLYKARIVLVGRAKLPERSEWSAYTAAYSEVDRIGKTIATVKRIEEAGGEVIYLRSDVTNPDSMRAAFNEARQHFGALHGVLHTAGLIKDDLIQLKTPSDIEDVLAPKVLGTMVLDEIVQESDLDWFVLFSSTSTETAPAGQIDYVGANAFLNAYADSRANMAGPHTVAVHWGVWNDVGLAARAVSQDGQNQALTTVVPAQQPLFDRRVEIADQSHRVEFQCSAPRYWILDEHRLKTGEAVWPGTGYLELVSEAAREFGVRGAFEVHDLAFLRPLYVPDGAIQTVAVSASRTEDGLRLEVESKVDTDNGAAWLRHADAVVTPVRSHLKVSRDIEYLRDKSGPAERSSDGETLRAAQEVHLNFGSRWRVLRESRVSRANNSAMALLQLDEAFRSDSDSGLILHPALMDIATGYAMDLIEDYDPAQGLWVPITYGRVVVHGALPSEIWSHATLQRENNDGSDTATFNIEILDTDGKLLVEVEDFTVKKLGEGTNLASGLENTSDARLEKNANSSSDSDLSPALLRLAAQVDQGIKPQEGLDALNRVLSTGQSQVIVSSLDLDGLIRAAATDHSDPSSTGGSERPTLDSTYVAPRNGVETSIAEFWSQLLGIDQIGVDDNFFDLGGHSLIAVRLFRMVRKEFAVDLPISVLFEAPTIAQVAGLIEQAGGGTAAGSSAESTPTATNAPATRNTHLVQMQPGRGFGRTPMFVCAGMFGNILNLRYLAQQIGQDRPVYGLQAKGLYGDEAPHETFEEMARDNLKELRTVQPHGPYLLGGFSGGGLVAYEMAQQLKDAGEQVSLVVLLDTPYPEDVNLSVSDRAAMKLQDMKREQKDFIGNWVKRRIAWELEKRRFGTQSDSLTSEQFHNDAIEEAFRSALARYSAKPYDAPVILLRPQLEIAYELSGGRNLNTDRCIVRPDNGWSPYVADLRIIEVPGNHDSMVLEPNVRVLSSHLRSTVEDIETTTQQFLFAAE